MDYDSYPRPSPSESAIAWALVHERVIEVGPAILIRIEHLDRSSITGAIVVDMRRCHPVSSLSTSYSWILEVAVPEGPNEIEWLSGSTARRVRPSPWTLVDALIVRHPVSSNGGRWSRHGPRSLRSLLAAM